MSYASSVEVVEGFGNLLEETTAGGLADLPIGAVVLDVLMETDATDVVGYNTDLFTSLYQIMHPDDVGMVYLLQSQYLTLNSLPLHAVV